MVLLSSARALWLDRVFGAVSGTYSPSSLGKSVAFHPSAFLPLPTMHFERVLRGCRIAFC